MLTEASLYDLLLTLSVFFSYLFILEFVLKVLRVPILFVDLVFKLLDPLLYTYIMIDKFDLGILFREH